MLYAYDFVGYFTNYNCLVNHTCNSDNLIKFESGYNLLVLIFGQLGYQLTIVAIAIFNVVCVFKFIQKNKIGNGSFVFFVLLTMLGWVLYIEAIRQAMAMSIFLYAIQKSSIRTFLLLCAIIPKFIIHLSILTSGYIPFSPLYSGKTI